MAPEIRSSDKLGNADRRFDSRSARDTSLHLTLLRAVSTIVVFCSPTLITIGRLQGSSMPPIAPLTPSQAPQGLQDQSLSSYTVRLAQIFSHLSFQEHATAAPPLFDSTSYFSSDSISRNSAIAVDTNAFIGGMTKPRNNGMVVIVPPLSLFSREVETTPSPLHRDTSFVGHTVHLQQTSRIPAPDESVIGGRRAFWSIKLYDSMPFAEVEDDEHLHVTVRESNASVTEMVETFARKFLGGSKVLGTGIIANPNATEATEVVTQDGVLVGELQRLAILTEFGDDSPDPRIGACETDHDPMVHPSTTGKQATLNHLQSWLIFHDGRLVKSPTPLNAIITYPWLPFGSFSPSSVSTSTSLSQNASSATPTSSSESCSSSTATNLSVCNHRTANEPIVIAIAIALGCKVSCVTCSVRGPASIPAMEMTQGSDTSYSGHAGYGSNDLGWVVRFLHANKLAQAQEPVSAIEGWSNARTEDIKLASPMQEIASFNFPIPRLAARYSVATPISRTVLEDKDNL